MPIDIGRPLLRLDSLDELLTQQKRRLRAVPELLGALRPHRITAVVAIAAVLVLFIVLVLELSYPPTVTHDLSHIADDSTAGLSVDAFSARWEPALELSVTYPTQTFPQGPVISRDPVPLPRSRPR